MIIEKKHHDYLFLQRGDISHITDMAQWKSAYAAALRATVNSIDEGIRAVTSSAQTINTGTPGVRAKIKVLDIGGGLGGVHTLIHQAFPLGYELYIVDGLTDPPIHKNSWQTFNNAEIGMDFLVRNGMKSAAFTDEIPLGHRFDLVVSFAAYGFYIHPGNYLDDLKKVVSDKTVLIFDVRRAKKEWLRDLVAAFGTPKVLHTAEKYVRLAFHV